MSVMDIRNVFNFKKSNEALCRLEKLLMCNDCNGFCENPRSHECGYLLCMCRKRDTCPGCGLRCLPSNTAPAYHINSIIEASKTIKMLISSEELEKTQEESNVVQKTIDKEPTNGIHNLAEPNIKKNNEDISSRNLVIPDASSLLKKKSETLNTKQLKDIKDVTRETSTSTFDELLSMDQNEDLTGASSKKTMLMKEMPANLKTIMKRNAKGETKLHSACIKGDSKKVEEYLKAGADPCTKDNAGWTPLHEAVSKGYMSIVKLLLDAGALVNVPGGYNNTPLHDAALNNHLEAARLLISFGANPHLRNIEGNTAVSMTQSKEMELILEGFDSSKSIEKSNKTQCYRHNVVLYGLELPSDELKWMTAVGERYKLKTTSSYSSDVTHIIVSTIDKRCTLSLIVLQGILKGKWIVDSKWLQSCLKTNSFEDPSEYEVIGTTRFPDSSAPKRSRKNSEKMQPSIFNGCYFYFSGVDKITVGDVKFTKSQLSSLITCGDGIVLTREPNPEAIPAHECTVPYHANDGIFAKCSHFILYQPGRREPLLKYNMPHVKSLPVSWLLDCIETFSLVELL